MAAPERCHVPTGGNLRAKPAAPQKLLFANKDEEWEQARPWKWSEALLKNYWYDKTGKFYPIIYQGMQILGTTTRGVSVKAFFHGSNTWPPRRLWNSHARNTQNRTGRGKKLPNLENY